MGLSDPEPQVSGDPDRLRSAQMDSRLKQLPAPTSRKRAAAKTPPKRSGTLWATVTILEENQNSPRLRCKNCAKEFCGGASRVQDHITGMGAVTACSCEMDAFLDLKLVYCHERRGAQPQAAA